MDKFLSSLHINDLNTGAKNVDEAFHVIFVNIKTGWRKAISTRSNSTELEQMVNKNYGMLTDEHKCLIENKILGLRWDKFEDNFIFDFNEIRERFDVIPTKHNVIKEILSIYDPLGLLNSIAEQMKTFLQKLCSAKYDWDDLISNDYLEEWNELVKSLSAIECISVLRLCYNRVTWLLTCVNESIRVLCVFTFFPQF